MGNSEQKAGIKENKRVESLLNNAVLYSVNHRFNLNPKAVLYIYNKLLYLMLTY